MVRSETNKEATKALQMTYDVLLGVSLFMEVMLNHGKEFIDPEHPEFESKRNELTDRLEQKMKEHPEIQETLERAATQVLMALHDSMAASIEKAAPPRIIQPGSLKLH